ncbi:MAG: hypothetical protein K2K93_00625 [Muribaculaceae bacterium]|nr:hypothetical protein [Muribaculaceae bacterium]
MVGVDAPDGLGAVTATFMGSLAQYSKIEDVKVTKDGSVLSFELDNPDRTVSFARVAR